MKNILKIILTFSISIHLFAAQTYIVNKEHSKIGFSVKYLGMNDVEGRFNDFEVYYEVEGNQVEKLEGHISSKSIDTANKKRDSHLRKNDFFDVKKYPAISLKLLKPFQLTLDKEQTIEVALTILNTTKTTQLKLIYLGPKTDPWTKVDGLYFKLSGEINRDDFGISWNKVLDDNSGFLIAKEVKINISIESYKSNEKPAFSRFFKERQSNGSKDENEVSENDLQEITPMKEVATATSSKIVEKAPLKESQYSSFTNVVLTLITGFIVFLLLIAFGIFSQKKISNFLEKKGFSETVTYIISSGFVMIILIIFSFLSAPLMGWGENPFLKYFN